MSDVAPNGAGPGATLKLAREARDMTQQDVSDTLNLMVRVVDDIEAERWSQLPPAAFSRGYLRAYAKLLELDPDAIVSAFDAAVGHARAGQDAVKFNAMPPARGGVADLLQKQPGTVLTAAVAVVICGVLVVLWAVWPEVSSTPAAVVATVPEALPKASPLSSAAGSAPPSAPDATQQPRAETQPAAAVASAPGTASASEPPVEQVVVAATPKRPGDPDSARRITADGNDRLTFAFTQDCWVEIKDRQGRNIYSDLSRAGQALELIGQAPFMIMLGYAPGVTLSFNGERVTLTPHTRNNVATLALGQ